MRIKINTQGRKNAKKTNGAKRLREKKFTSIDDIMRIIKQTPAIKEINMHIRPSTCNSMNIQD